jgi:hypothetical protein
MLGNRKSRNGVGLSISSTDFSLRRSGCRIVAISRYAPLQGEPTIGTGIRLSGDLQEGSLSICPRKVRMVSSRGTGGKNKGTNAGWIQRALIATRVHRGRINSCIRREFAGPCRDGYSHREEELIVGNQAPAESGAALRIARLDPVPNGHFFHPAGR